MTFQSKLTRCQKRINDVLATNIKNQPLIDKKLLDAMEYGLLIGGKRVRPYLTYATGEMIGASKDDLDIVAASVECIHAYSLLHDDLPAMDDDDLRRGKPTCHIAFDEATAILAGDSLQTLAFDLLANQPLSLHIEKNRIGLIRELTQASGYNGMCGGQAIDLAATNKQISLEQLETMHKLKTGALLKASITMACLCIPSIPTEHLNSLTRFAEAIGLAYQVRDDIIDITSDEKVLGKPKGSDIAANKTTYPALLGLEGAQQKADSLFQEALQALNSLPYNTENLSEFATFIISRDS